MTLFLQYAIIKKVKYKGENKMETYTLQENLRKLNDIKNLKDNWNGYNAKSIPKEIIEKTKKIITNLSYQPFLAPTGRETIQIEFELTDASYLGFEIFKNKITMLYVPQRLYDNALVKDLNIQTDLDPIITTFIENGLNTDIRERL